MDKQLEVTPPAKAPTGPQEAREHGQVVLVPNHFWQGFLHNQSSIPLKRILFSRPNTVVVGIPYRLRG